MQDDEQIKIYVSCPMGLQYVLEKELIAQKVNVIKAVPGGVYAWANKIAVYRILMWSRIANRVILQLKDLPVSSIEDVYQAALDISWDEHFSLEQRFSVHFSGTNAFVRNTAFGALKIKDAIVDYFREKTGERPSVSREQPDIQVVGVLSKGKLTLGVDLSGQSLHQRGYRVAAGKAPLKENLAAGILTLLNWPDNYPTDASLVDPMCGSGTFIIEAAMMARGIAPALLRTNWPISHWKQHDEAAYDHVVSEARKKAEEVSRESQHRFFGYDQDGQVIAKAWKNLERVGHDMQVHFERCELESLSLPAQAKPGLVVVNPPYGQRLGEVEQLKHLYGTLGEVFASEFGNWQAAVLTSNLDLGRCLGWRSQKQYKLFNGALESQLIRLDLQDKNRFKEAWKPVAERLGDPSYWKVTNETRAEMFKNRLLKNLKVFRKWANKNEIHCYRIYDADMPEYALAVDQYEENSGERWLHVQEYVAPKGIDPRQALERLREALAVIRDLQIVESHRIVFKQREKQKGSSQYERLSDKSGYLKVSENGNVFLVNLVRYLDTGLFLDHRPIRQWIQQNAKDKRFLNLFCYTGAVTVAAIKGGARESLSLDLSKTYLDWAERNLEVNGMTSTRHKFSQTDCTQWLRVAAKENPQLRYDLIFLDPPSFSNSKRMEGVLDIQRDHVKMIEQAMSLLSNEGTLVFSTNLRKFKLDPAVKKSWNVSDYTQSSIDRDFARHAKIHQCWMIKKDRDRQ